jgi:holo-[acyl-carrier protein] synthase
MPFAVGIDLVSPEEVEQAMTTHGPRYLQRIYAPEELADAGSDPQRLAARFAAKEATMKALRRDDEPLDWRAIVVTRDSAGRPALRLTGAAGELARRAGVRQLSLSLSHEPSLAAAVVLAEMEDP